MKKTLKTCLPALLLAALLLVVLLPAAPAHADSAGYVSASTLHLRTGPSTSYSIVTTLSHGTALTITATSGNWYAVKVDSSGQTGYVYASYVTLGANAVDVTPITGSSSAYINGRSVNIRTGPSTKYKSLGRLNYGTALTVNGTSGSWYSVTVTSTGTAGYVYSTYVTLNSSAPAETPATATGSYINASGVNFRKGPSTKYSSIGKLSSGTAVTVTGSSGNWYLLTVNSSGVTGYVYNRYVTLGTELYPSGSGNLVVPYVDSGVVSAGEPVTGSIGVNIAP